MLHAMIDLETLGTRHDSAIVQIGVVAFDRDGVDLCTGRRIDVRPGSNARFTPDSVAWWLRQDDKAREGMAEALECGGSLCRALEDLSVWIADHGPDCVWAYPASFDLFLLTAAYERLGLDVPWCFRAVRCCRQFFNGALPKRQRAGTHHDALDDAVHQATIMVAHGGF